MKQLLLFFFLITLGLACSKDDVNPSCNPEPQANCNCPELVLARVCGCDGVTYENPCLAECSNVFDYTEGACP
ncbi:MAG: Kazal-type serine protease inhibitor domain-containing protein [Bacteroidota bacterium]